MEDLQILTRKIEQLEARVDHDLASRQRGNRVTVIGGGILFIAVLAYFAWIHSLVADVAQPASVATLAAEGVKGVLPEVAQSFETELARAAPSVAAEARIQAIASFPKIREWLERETTNAASPYIVTLSKEMDVIIQQGINKDRDAFAALVKDSDTPEARKQFQDVVQKSLRSYFDDPLVAADLKGYTNVLNSMDAKFKRLRDGKMLNPEEQLQRNLIVAMRELASRSEKLGAAKP